MILRARTLCEAQVARLQLETHLAAITAKANWGAEIGIQIISFFLHRCWIERSMRGVALCSPARPYFHSSAVPDCGA